MVKLTMTSRKPAGLKFNFNAFSTAEEYDSAAKRPNACVEEANSNLAYRDGLPKVWKKLAEAVQAKHNIPFITVPKTDDKGAEMKDEKGQPIMILDEAYPAYVARAAATLAVKVETFQPLLDEICGEGFVLDPTEREAGEKKLAVGKQLRELAKAILAAPNKDEYFSKIGTYIGEIIPPDVDEEALAVYLKKRQQKKDEEAKQEFAGLTV